jgi:hypothetical protein
MDGDGRHLASEGFAIMNVSTQYDWLCYAEMIEIVAGVGGTSIITFVELQNNVMRIWLLNCKDLSIA